MSDVQELSHYCLQLASQAKAASRQLSLLNTQAKNDWLLAAAQRLLSAQEQLLQANAKDVDAAPGLGLNAAAIDRLKLTPSRIAAAVQSLRQVAALPDPVGEVREGGTRPNGLQVLKVGVPLGVIFFLYESRPNVTVDAAGLCVKSGNAVILRGGKEAIHSNSLLHELLTEDLPRFNIPQDAVQIVSTTDRAAVGELLKLNNFIDLVIPRGGESLIRRVCEEATMPVLKHYQGNCHIYVDESADDDTAERIIINAKCQRPGVCNAAESLVVHHAIATRFLPKLATALQSRGVELRGCPRTLQILRHIPPATESDYAAEYLDLILSVVIVDNLDQAIAHINRYGSGHTDAIITQSMEAARKFTQAVDSSAVIVNASTRFNDGFELGLGAEIGISTDKFHARGPCGLRELTTYKYVINGTGQIRE